MGCSPHTFLRVQKIQFTQRIIVKTETKAKTPAPDAKDDLKTLPMAEVEKKLGSSPDGLTQAEAQKRLTQYGPNELVEKKTNLLLKFLDVRDTLSVQVHPSDQQTQYVPAGETGKTEAWVVLEAGAKSRIYAGLKPARIKFSP